MAKKFYHDIDLSNLGQLLGARGQNVTSAEMNALAANLGVANAGLFVWNTDENKQYHWTGMAFVADQIDVVGDIKFKGVLSLLDEEIEADADGTPKLSVYLPTEFVSGHQYLIGPSYTNAAGDTVMLGNGSFRLEIYTASLLPGGAPAVNPSTNTEIDLGMQRVSAGDQILIIESATTPGQFEAVVIQANLDEAKLAELFADVAALELRVDDVERTNLQQTNRLNFLEIQNADQEVRIQATSAEVNALDLRVDAVEAKNIEQDGRLTALEAEVDSLQANGGDLDERLDAVEAKNIEQDGRLGNVEQNSVQLARDIRFVRANSPKQFFNTYNIVAGVNVIQHNMGLTAEAGFVIQVVESATKEVVSFETVIVNNNTIHLISLVNVGDVTVYISGLRTDVRENELETLNLAGGNLRNGRPIA